MFTIENVIKFLGVCGFASLYLLLIYCEADAFFTFAKRYKEKILIYVVVGVMLFSVAGFTLLFTIAMTFGLTGSLNTSQFMLLAIILNVLTGIGAVMANAVIDDDKEFNQ